MALEGEAAVPIAFVEDTLPCLLVVVLPAQNLVVMYRHFPP
jgi:hypothetical protein